MKSVKFIAICAALAAFPVSARAQVSGDDVAGMTVEATTVDGGGVERGTESAVVTDVGGGLFEALPPDPSIPGFFSAVVQYCDPSTTCFGFAPFTMLGGTWTVSYYSWALKSLVLDASTSGAVFTGTAAWLAQFPGDPAFDYGTFTFLNAVSGGYSKLQIDFAPSLEGEAPFALGMETADLSAVPEPSTWLLMCTGLLGVALVAVRRRRAAHAIA
jgi:hypothetical protein